MRFLSVIRQELVQVLLHLRHLYKSENPWIMHLTTIIIFFTQFESDVHLYEALMWLCLPCQFLSFVSWVNVQQRQTKRYGNLLWVSDVRQALSPNCHRSLNGKVFVFIFREEKWENKTQQANNNNLFKKANKEAATFDA